MSSLSALYARKQQLQILKNNVQKVALFLNNGNKGLNVADDNIIKCFLINENKADNKKINNILEKNATILNMIPSIISKIEAEIAKVEAAINAEIARLAALNEMSGSDL